MYQGSILKKRGVAFLLQKGWVIAIQSNHEKACQIVQQVLNLTLPFKERGIKIDKLLIKATIEILNAAPSKTLPQNCRNDVRIRTPDGLDRRTKDALNTDLRTANIISDILAECGIDEITKVDNPLTGREVKGTKLLDERCWGRKHDLVIARERAPAPATDKIMDSRSKRNNINRDVYLGDKYTREFIQWLEQKLDGPFHHSCYLKNDSKEWNCSCPINR